MPRHFGEFLEARGSSPGVFLVKQSSPVGDVIDGAYLGGLGCEEWKDPMLEIPPLTGSLASALGPRFSFAELSSGEQPAGKVRRVLTDDWNSGLFGSTEALLIFSASAPNMVWRKRRGKEPGRQSVDLILSFENEAARR